MRCAFCFTDPQIYWNYLSNMNKLIFYSSLHYGLPDFYLQLQLTVEETEVDT